ncbi:sugar nucleotide-binding protein [Tessaracoccus flavus]|uniref:dTDP-4-dehydrorhamnose reductase n=1 Tax=Tessaracoccus flavus TaxID=1610493 RepID=A0A1Q2CHF5_9ACTN|nr:sugar nucleotide-binding protein [Tessaracoccus flavus]AQP45549.1 dTDP-4-dehydrorhamnose reductase [Tessaracoccus flavus]SDY79342.1 dTDP-4-dehydrorhamnose 3,5-epimerase [Tessaracoccus flavus]
MTNELRVSTTDIPGLLVVDLPVHGDSRGWFKENWQRDKMTALGVPDFQPVQNNMSFNADAGVTRGIHAEPWDKLVSVATGRVFGAWVDLRAGETFGTVVTAELTPGRAVFVPRGVGNAYQALDPGTCYSYLVNEHWSADAKAKYTFANLRHPDIRWPLPLDGATISEADRSHPSIADVVPFRRPRPVVTGSNGQLGTALQALIPEAIFVDRADLDITDADAVAAFDWSEASCIINAAAWTAVDAAEGEGRAACWAVNVAGTANLVAAARRHRLPLVHISSDYVFDGSRELHTEDEPFAPLSAYGAAKAAADAVVGTLPRHYILRTSWVIGEGSNFVRTMARLADTGASPAVVDDQFGRLTFADDLARAALHLMHHAEPGTYNVTSDGGVVSWFDVAQAVFEARGAAGQVSRTSTEEFAAGKLTAPRPRHSALDLTKLRATGFVPVDGGEGLRQYLAAMT